MTSEGETTAAGASTAGRASGWFAYERWWLDLVGDDDRAVDFASGHESHHKQLSDSTCFGFLARLLRRLGEVTGTTDYKIIAQHLTRAAEPVQEAFASWVPATALGWTRKELGAAYPAYVRHHDTMDRLVGPVVSPYLRFHAAHAAARVCMQAPVHETALAVGLARFRLADLRRHEQPEHRFMLLRRNVPNWEAIVARVGERFAGDSRWRAVHEAGALTADLFAPMLRDLWSAVNAAVYDELAAFLARFGAPTLPHEGHRAAIDALLSAAYEVSGGADLRLAARAYGEGEEPARLVLANIESEDFGVGPPLRARLVPPTTPAARMVADVELPHLFLTVRGNAQLRLNYAFEGPAIAAGGVGAYLRRTVVEPRGVCVELREIRGPAELDEVGVPTFAAVALSAFDAELRRRWGPQLGSKRAVVIIDAPLGPQLEVWLGQPHGRFRHAFIRTEPHGRVVPFLVGVYDIDGVDASHLMLRPLSPAAVRKMKAAFDELDPERDQLVEAPELVTAHEPLLGLTLAHLALEEVRFELIR